MSKAISDIYAKEAAAASAAFRLAADAMMKARRYVRSHPAHVEAETERAMNVMYDAPARMRFTPYVVETRVRIVINLCDGLKVIRSDPLVLEGHLYAAARLLQSIARRIETGAEA